MKLVGWWSGQTRQDKQSRTDHYNQRQMNGTVGSSFGAVPGMDTTKVNARIAERAGWIFGIFIIFSGAISGFANAQATGMQGDAAWNESRTSGERTASGERYDPESMTAASKDLPFDSLVRIIRVDDGKTVVVRINDRTAGDEHIIHLSEAAARHMGIAREQSALIQLKQLSGASLTVVRRPGRDSNNTVRRAENRVMEVTVGEDNRDAPIDTDTSLPELTRVEENLSLRYTLQIAVFSSRNSADTFSREISESWILPVQVDGNSQYRVYFGRFSEESPARVAQKSLRREGRDSFLRKI